MFTKIIAVAALSLGVLGFDMIGQASAGVSIDLGIGGGRISCRQGARIVANAGFRRVRPIDCSGREYSYRGIRRGRMFEIDVRSRNGRIISVDRIGGGGGYGGYGGYGDYDDDDEY